MPVTKTETRDPNRVVFYFSPPQNPVGMFDSTRTKKSSLTHAGNRNRDPRPEPSRILLFAPTIPKATEDKRKAAATHRGQRRHNSPKQQGCLAEQEDNQPRPEENKQHSGDSPQKPPRTPPSSPPNTATTPAHTRGTEGAAQPKERRDPTPTGDQSGGWVGVEKKPPSERGKADGTDETMGGAGSRQTRGRGWAGDGYGSRIHSSNDLQD